MLTVSIVSHGHSAMVEELVSSLLCYPIIKKIIITRNVPEIINLSSGGRVQIIDNISPKGFGANHNAAFAHCSQPFFCVLNPDIKFTENPFPKLFEVMAFTDANLSVPLVVSPEGKIEDSVRRFPTLSSLCIKGVGGDDGRYKISVDDPPFSPEWAAGMFMLFRSESFRRIRGFDESYFLYYEDVDICVRLWKAGMKLVVCPSVSVIHDARRASRRELQHMKWHAASMLKYLWKHGRGLPTVV